MAGIRLSRRKFVALAGAAVAGAPFVNLGNYRLFVQGENFRPALGKIWVS